MNREILLDKLAMELAEWPVTADEAKRVMPEGWYWRGDDGAIHVGGGLESFSVTAPDWLQRRTELINRPSWADAPEWAEWLAQDESGKWHWYEMGPECFDRQWDDHDSKIKVAASGICPAGHDWRETLEKRPTPIKTCRHCDVSFQRPSVSGIPDDRCERCHDEIMAMRWDEGRADAIGQNGPTGDHYAENRPMATCACGDMYPMGSYGAEFMAANCGICENCAMANDEPEETAHDCPRYNELGEIVHDCPRCGGEWWSPPHEYCPCMDAGAHYRREYKGVKLDPYRIAKVYDMQGGPREQIMKKCLRFIEKGQTERQVVNEIRTALVRWEEMLEEDGQ